MTRITSKISKKLHIKCQMVQIVPIRSKELDEVKINQSDALTFGDGSCNNWRANGKITKGTRQINPTMKCTVG